VEAVHLGSGAGQGSLAGPFKQPLASAWSGSELGLGLV
jgi:hypothetical protein